MTDVFKKFNSKTKEKDSRVYVFIDASNVWESYKAKGRFLDFEKILNFIKKTFKASLVKVFYYTAYPADGTRDYDLGKKHNFYTFLKKGLGFEVKKKKLKRIKIIDEKGERIQEKGDMDVEITIDAIHHSNKYDIGIFFSGDSDFLALISYLKNNNKRIFIFSSKNNVSKELKSGGDGYCDLLKIEEIWGGKLHHRKSK